MDTYNSEMVNSFVNTSRRRFLDTAEAGARNYAAFDKSDPFSYARAKCHLASGVVGMVEQRDGTMVPAIYEATPVNEQRSYTFEGRTVEYSATVYRNVRRP